MEPTPRRGRMSSRLRPAVAAPLLAALLLASGCGATSPGPAAGPSADPTPGAASAPAGDVSSLDVHGAAGRPPPRDAELVEADWPATAAWIAREADAGRPVVVNFFASWCGPCRREAPLLEQARREHPEVAFLGIAYRDFEPDARQFLEETGLGFATLADFDGSVGAQMSVRGMPNTYFFAADGQLVAHELGELSPDTLAERLRQITGARTAAIRGSP